MSTLSKLFEKSIEHATKKTGAQQPPKPNKKFVIVLFCLMLGISVSLKSQAPSPAVDLQPASTIKGSTPTRVANNTTNCFLPVYFNFRRRQLVYNGIQRMDPVAFLTMCRGINDSTVQAQIARYDDYTREKQKLGFGALGCGFASFGLLGAATTTTRSGDEALTASLVFTGVLALIAVPVIAIYSGVPHKKRKAVLFRDLPIAYNGFVESQQSNPECASVINP